MSEKSGIVLLLQITLMSALTKYKWIFISVHCLLKNIIKFFREETIFFQVISPEPSIEYITNVSFMSESMKSFIQVYCFCAWNCLWQDYSTHLSVFLPLELHSPDLKSDNSITRKMVLKVSCFVKYFWPASGKN